MVKGGHFILLVYAALYDVLHSVRDDHLLFSFSLKTRGFFYVFFDWVEMSVSLY